MSVTEVGICNSALIKLGADRISSLTQNTKPAELCNTVFDGLRDEVLRAHPWNFAIKRAVLSPTATTPDFEYDYEFDMPNDCLRVLDMDDDEIDWVLENGKILTNESTLNCRYIFKNEDPSSWDSMFAEALACRIAMQLAYALTQSSQRVADLQKEYVASITMARSMDGAEGILKGLVADDWTNERKR